MRDLVRAREAAVKDRTCKRQEIRSFLLRIGKIYPGKKAWGTRYFKWLHALGLAWPAHVAVLNEMILAEMRCRERVARLDQAIETPCSTGILGRKWSVFRRSVALA